MKLFMTLLLSLFVISAYGAETTAGEDLSNTNTTAGEDVSNPKATPLIGTMTTNSKENKSLMSEEAIKAANLVTKRSVLKCMSKIKKATDGLTLLIDSIEKNKVADKLSYTISGSLIGIDENLGSWTVEVEQYSDPVFGTPVYNCTAANHKEY